jgi:hypothetical protein
MRSEPTAAEQEAQSQLFRYLFLEGTPAKLIERDLNDRPDLAFELKDKRIACECVQIPDSSIIRWHHKRHAELTADPSLVRCLATIWPIEPHSWVAQAIKSKVHMVAEYRAAINADETWLYIHAHDDNFMEEIFASDTIRLMYVGATSLQHGFDKIVFYDKRCGVQIIYWPGMPKYTKTTDLSAGYPAVTLIQYSGAAFTTTEEGEPPRVYEYEVHETVRIVVPPIDPAFVKRGEPSVRIKPAKRLVITAYSDRAEPVLIFD